MPPTSNPDNRAAQNNRSTYWQTVFGTDPRALVVFRVMLGLLVMLDVRLRWPDLAALYTDEGYFTRALADQYYTHLIGDQWRWNVWSVQWLTGELFWIQTLFVIQAIAGAFLLLGGCTRLATIVAWVLVVSAHIRCPLTITSGDTLLKLMLFWSMFLPLGRWYSLDAAWRRDTVDRPDVYASPATAGLIMQIILMYFFTGVAKWNSLWFDGSAMEYVLRLGIHVESRGTALLAYPMLLKLTSWGTLFIELVLLWFLLVPKYNALWRYLNWIAYSSFHLGIAYSMAIGLFPLICLTAWVPLIPRSFWNLFWPQTQVVPSDTSRSAKTSGQYFYHTLLGKLSIVGAGAVTLLVLLWNLANIEGRRELQALLPAPLRTAGFWLAQGQHFQMFGIPPQTNPWFVFEGELVNGDKVDLFCRGAVLNRERPESILATIPSHNWRRVLQNLTNPKVDFMRNGILAFAARRWNQLHSAEQQVVSARLICFTEELGPKYQPTDFKAKVWEEYFDASKKSRGAFDELLDRVKQGNDLPF